LIPKVWRSFRHNEILLTPDASAETFFTVLNVKIGIDFHWQRVQEQSFRGALLLTANPADTFHLINVNPARKSPRLGHIVGNGSKRTSGVSQKHEAVTARSWLLAMLAKKKSPRASLKKRRVKFWSGRM